MCSQTSELTSALAHQERSTHSRFQAVLVTCSPLSVGNISLGSGRIV